jgi:hypothetical protein
MLLAFPFLMFSLTICLFIVSCTYLFTYIAHLYLMIICDELTFNAENLLIFRCSGLVAVPPLAAVVEPAVVAGPESCGELLPDLSDDWLRSILLMLSFRMGFVSHRLYKHTLYCQSDWSTLQTSLFSDCFFVQRGSGQTALSEDVSIVVVNLVDCGAQITLALNTRYPLYSVNC